MRKQVRKYLMRFLVVIRGARTPPPRIEEPVTKMPLDIQSHLNNI